MNEKKDKKVRRIRIAKRILAILASIATATILFLCCYWVALPEPHVDSTARPLPVYSTLTPLPSFTPLPTISTPVPTPRAYITVDADGVNVRSGPDTTYAIIGVLNAGDEAAITGYYGKWWRIEYEGVGWVAAWVVSAHNTDSVPLVAIDEKPTVVATYPATVYPTSASTIQPAPCPCSSNSRNCSDFASRSQAQECYDYCWDAKGYDVHRLDSDGDGQACEDLGE